MFYDTEVLRAWYETYKADTSIKPPIPAPLIEKELDVDQIELEIEELLTATQLVDGFCSKCQKLFANWPDFAKLRTEQTETVPIPLRPKVKVQIPFHDNTQSMEAAARKGCWLCAILIGALREPEYLGEGYLSHFRTIEQRLYHIGNIAPLTISIQQNYVFVGNRDDPSEKQWLDREADADVWLNLPGKPNAVLDQTNPTMLMFSTCEECSRSSVSEKQLLTAQRENIFPMISGWLHGCSEQHEKCSPSGVYSLPTRLIELSDPPVLVVTASKDWPEIPRYATLSHCWGGLDFFCLTDDNFEHLTTKGVSMSSLTKTFKDAISIARGVGLSYLWIDSLCIIQGNREDWAKEAMTMSAVYSESALNIAASSAANGHGGCFTKPKSFCDGFHVEIKGGGQRLFGHIRRDPDTTYSRATRLSHLATRAWCFQERVLSPRTIFCGDRGIWWECKQHIASEFFPITCAPSEHGWQDLPFLMGGLANFCSVQDGWKEIVTLYTQCRLTFGDDKLVAFAGIARAVHESNGFEYLAGMWKPWLIDLLGWGVDPRDKYPKPSTYRAPSWSWAAIDGTVHCGRKHDPVSKYFAHVLDANATPAGIDPFAQVASGVLTLCCSYILPGRLCAQSGAGRFTIATINYEVQVDMDYVQTSILIDVATVIVPLHFASRSPGPGTRCLVLRPTGHARGEYFRIGFFIFFPKMYGEEYDDVNHGQRILFDLFWRPENSPCRQVFDDLRATMPELACEERDSTYPDAPFVINVV